MVLYASKSTWPSLTTVVPKKATVPSSGAVRPERIEATVDLPEPFAPTIQVRLPAGIENETWSKAITPFACTKVTSKSVAATGRS